MEVLTIMSYFLKKSIPCNLNGKENVGLSNYHFRRGTVNDALCIASLFQLGYGKSSHPCNDEEYVRIALTSEDDYWFVAEDEFSSVIGCLCISYNLMHRTWEIGKAMISPLHRQLGVMSRLMRLSIDSTPISMSDLIFIELRSDTSYHTLQKYVDVVIVGYDGGLNTVGKGSEHHVIAIAKFSSDKCFRHCFPNEPVFVESSYLRENIISPLGLSREVDEYPSRCFFWGGGGRGESDFLFSMDKQCNLIRLGQYIGSDSASEKDVFSALCKFLKCFDTDVRVTSIVIADKLMLITDMICIGFRITSYLPAWYWLNGKRYDCLMLVRGGGDYVRDNGLGDYVKKFDVAYHDIEEKIIKKRWG
ncbi:TPA: GNAT family N-acetyltransferase [Serratia marcescens]